MNLYDFVVYDNKGELISLSQYQGKMLLIFNSCPICYLTSLYKDIEILYREFSFLGLEVLDFPSDSFSEIGMSDEEIDSFIKENYHTTFKRLKKVNLKGFDKEPLFFFLEQQIKFQGFDKKDKFYQTLDSIVRREDPLYEKHRDIKWNFTFFLISKEGEVLRRFEPSSDISKIRRALKTRL